VSVRTSAIAFLLSIAFLISSNGGAPPPHYTVLNPISQGNLTVFPVTASTAFNTGGFITLDEGIRSGKVIVTEKGGAQGLVRPRPSDGVWRERPFPFHPDAPEVNRLALINNSDRPLLLLAGEIVTGGKQDRVVSKDRIVPGHGEPVDLDVFCVEPHRWIQSSVGFGTSSFLMAQPSIRSKAMADQDQQEVWNQVARSRAGFLAIAPEAGEIRSSSSYAVAAQNRAVQQRIDSLAIPLARSYENLPEELRLQHAVGAVVAVNQQVIWADVFADASLFEHYWPKLVRSYAAEALLPLVAPAVAHTPATREAAQIFLDTLAAKHESIETEPGIYRTTEISGDDYDAFILTSLLPNTGFTVHLAKMKH